MGWLTIGGGSSSSNSNTSTQSNNNTYGTHTPILSQDYLDAIKNYSGQLNRFGANPFQQVGQNMILNAANAGGIVPTVEGVNRSLADLSTDAANFEFGGPHLLGSAPLSADPQRINPMTGASMMAPYQNNFTNDVVGTTLANYDRHAADQLNALRASRGAGSAFGDRAAINDQTYMFDSDMNRAQVEAQLRNLGFTNAASLGQQDASRFLTGDTTNAQLGLNNNQFNSSLINQRDIANQGAQYQTDQTKMAAIAQRSGLAQQQLQNLVTANGINMEYAQYLLASGAMTQSQLSDIVNMLNAGNGYSYTQNTSGASSGTSSGRTNTNNSSFDLGLT